MTRPILRRLVVLAAALLARARNIPANDAPTENPRGAPARVKLP